MSETTQTQLPAWAKDAGWTEQDVADGWKIGRESIYRRADSAELDDVFVECREVYLRAPNGDQWTVIKTATSPAAARQCALDIVAAIKRARGEQG
jgi:hypothetical protein